MTTTGGMMMSKPQPVTRNQEATIYVGNLDEKATEPLLWEMMVQAGPVVHVHIPRDRVTQQHQGYGFCEFQSEEDAEYAVKIMNGIRLFGKIIRINKSSLDKKSFDVGANLFIGNLAPDVDEKLLFDTFILFGTLIQTPKIARDDATAISRGYGFISYDSFEASDAAIEAMNGQYLCNRPVTINYAFKKDGKGERHGSAAERLLASQSKKAAMVATGNQTVTSSQFSIQKMQMQPQMIAHGGTIGVLPPNMMYPSNVPASMYYSTMYPMNAAAYTQASMQGYHHPHSNQVNGLYTNPPSMPQQPYYYPPLPPSMQPQPPTKQQ